MKRIIWTSEIDNSDEAINAFREEYGLEGDSDIDVLSAMYDLNSSYLDDERGNLDLELAFPILVIADLGLWNGRKLGYKILGSNVNEIFDVTCGDNVTFYADSHNICCRDAHHDGTNFYLFRVLRCLPEQASPLLDAIYYKQTFTSSMLNRYTRSLRPFVADVYGWNPKAVNRKGE